MIGIEREFQGFVCYAGSGAVALIMASFPGFFGADFFMFSAMFAARIHHPSHQSHLFSDLWGFVCKTND